MCTECSLINETQQLEFRLHLSAEQGFLESSERILFKIASTKLNLKLEVDL